ncbi:hypothetical protein EDB86DRAFT_3087164 [Lactarius hatsudake]|nr:hypothetical protein EDB86DRAFT_3087164 [Lactarius hatsudake]
MGGLASSQPVPFPPLRHPRAVLVQPASKSRHQRYAKSHALINYDLFDLLILHLVIPAPADDDHCFHITFPPCQGCYFPHFLRAALMAARHHLHHQISVLPAASGDAPIISELDMICTDFPVSSSFPHMSEMFLSHSPTKSTHAPAPPLPQRSIVSTPTDIRAAQPTACPTAGAPIPLLLGLVHVPRSRLPSSHASRSTLAPSRCVRSTAHFELSADDADACAPHLAVLVTTLALSALTLPAFNRSCSSRRPALLHLTLLCAFFDHLLAAPACARFTHIALLHFAGVPSAPAPHLAALDSSPGLAAVLSPSRPLRRVTPCIANTLYDGLRPAALFGALIGALKGLILVLTPDVGVRAHGPLLGALGNSGAGLETPELSFKGISDEVSLKAPYKQVGPLLPNVQALRTVRLRTVTTEAAQAEEGPSRLAL